MFFFRIPYAYLCSVTTIDRLVEMKKLLGIVVLGLFISSNAYAGWMGLGQLIENVFGIPYELAGFIIGTIGLIYLLFRKK